MRAEGKLRRMEVNMKADFLRQNEMEAIISLKKELENNYKLFLVHS